MVVSSQALTASSTTKLACSGPNGTDLSSTQHYVQDSSRDRTGPPEAISMAGTLFTGMLHSAFLQRFYISTFLSTSCRDPRHSSQKRPPQRPVRGPGLSISLFFGVPHTPFLPTVLLRLQTQPTARPACTRRLRFAEAQYRSCAAGTMYPIIL